MNFTTKFSPGDKAFHIHRMRVERNVHCATCGKTGQVEIGGEKFICPKCGGRSRHREFAGDKWFIDQHGWQGEWDTISNLEVRAVHPDMAFSHSYETRPVVVTYQFGGAGRRLGTVMNEENLFATREAAQAECDRRNADTSWEDDAPVIDVEHP